MSFVMTTADYMGYLKLAAQKIQENGPYITRLDAETGDGDHWANINLGFSHLVAAEEELNPLPIDDMFKKIGMIMMSKIGGSSGVLYGGAYLAASKAVAGTSTLTSQTLCLALDAMVRDMMERGKAKPGFKTMIDALYPAVRSYQQGLASGKPDAQVMADVKQAALQGAEATRDMEAVKGRASYQTNKGVGHLDPGAVTMYYQLECLCDYVTANLL